MTRKRAVGIPEFVIAVALLVIGGAVLDLLRPKQVQAQEAPGFQLLGTAGGCEVYRKRDGINWVYVAYDWNGSTSNTTCSVAVR